MIQPFLQENEIAEVLTVHACTHPASLTKISLPVQRARN